MALKLDGTGYYFGWTPVNCIISIYNVFLLTKNKLAMLKAGNAIGINLPIPHYVTQGYLQDSELHTNH